MDSSLTNIKNEISRFLLVNFLITFGMGILMFLVYKDIDDSARSGFAIVQMMYPALSAIGMKIYYEKDGISNKLMDFFKLYIFLSILAIIILVIGVFVFPSHVSTALNILVIVSSIVTFILIFNNEENCFEQINMVFKKNFRSVSLYCLLFIMIKLIRIIVGEFFYENSFEVLKTIRYIIALFIDVPISIVISSIIFFGEELGWREYLQPRLQILFGKKLGVIILGFIWGIWHLPLCFMLYSPSTPIYCVISHVSYCILSGIFLGFVYMRTENLWSVIILHLINNINYTASATYGAIITLDDLIIGLILNAAIFLPFLFTKEYKD
ncbi:CPBP family intramembrane metalloprotease [Tissierella sp. MSJ-40]|uniref:CPBP family intramembrane metalloprotease n=1 Tax=Tissierella simiarum TaxID=2841534 RepID=A0ABS6E8H0_9FIRM|nr:type II CAAX endopeptidase family protein [Tissierella simiarum]MBU5439214.1 CPBP family intramembrane metalloprotease [Tissierella simiarum]